jgi:hypothetical protein
MTNDEFLAAFETCTFTRPEWTHEAHVRMAWIYLSRFPFETALDNVRQGIQKLNGTLGSPDGYHETITVAFVRVIADRIRAGEDYPVFCERNPDLLDRTLTALLRYYTREKLWSAEARREFIEPDLAQLPASLETIRSATAPVGSASTGTRS